MSKKLLQSYEITVPTLDDVKAVRGLLARLWIDTYPNDAVGVSRAWVENRVSTWESPEALEKSTELIRQTLAHPETEFYRVATTQDGLAGMVHANKKDTTQELDALYVDTRYHGTGTAQALMDEAMKWLNLREDIELWVANYNDRAIKFYSKYSFVVVPGTDRLHHEKIPIVKMTRRGN